MVYYRWLIINQEVSCDQAYPVFCRDVIDVKWLFNICTILCGKLRSDEAQLCGCAGYPGPSGNICQKQ